MIATSESTISVRNLRKTFGDFVAVDDVSFDVSRGEVYGWLGPNGAGKTTTIRMLLGLLKPTSGEARVLGYDPATQAKAMQARVGYMSQLSRQALRRRHDEIIAMAGLRGRERVLTRNLSGGWKQRLALGCAIVHEPRVVFLDEPTAGVDPISRREFWELIYDMARRGVTVLVTTHYMDEAELCQRVGFLSQGRLIALDTPDQLKRTHMRGHVLEIDTDSSERAVRVLRRARDSGRLLLQEIALYGAQIHAVVPDAEAYRGPVRDLLVEHGVGVRQVAWIAPTLEDVFISSVKAREE